MINVTIYKDSSDNYTGFKLKGHAGFAEAGHDIICAGVSALVFNTVNSIEEITEDHFELQMNEKKGLMELLFTDAISYESQILMKSLVIGLNGISEDNGNYLQIVIKEV